MKSPCAAHTLGVVSYAPLHNLFGIILYEEMCLFTSIYYFIQLFIYISMDSYLLYMVLCYLLFLCVCVQIFPRLPIRSSLSLLLCPFDITPAHAFLLFKHFLTFCHYKMLQADFVYFLLQSLKHNIHAQDKGRITCNDGRRLKCCSCKPRDIKDCWHTTES